MSEERVLWQGRPSFWNTAVWVLMGHLLVLLAAALWWAGDPRFAPVALGTAVIPYAAAVLSRASVLYTVTDQRVRAQSGLFSRRVDEVEVGDIRSITLDQTFLERMLGLGSIGVSTAAGEGIEVVLKGVPNAEAVKETVRAARLAAGGKDE